MRVSVLLQASLCIVCSLFSSPAQAIEGVDCRIAATAIRSASRIRALEVKRAVPCKLQNRKEVEQYLRSTIDEKIPAERIRKEGLVNRMIGIVPPDYKYLEGIIELYREQIGGYYDPEKEYYAMAAWMPAMMQMPVAVHELTHALQDQHFELDALIDHKTQRSDSLLARSALVEGDATAVMIDYSRGLAGQGPLKEETSVSMFMIQNISGAMLSPSMQKAPVALQASLIFPYVSGIRFAHSLLKQEGYKSIDAAFSRLPRSTEEILHPEKYASEEADFIEVSTPKPPEDAELSSSTPLYVDTLGEFLISSLLSTYISPLEASEAASGWGGDTLVLYDLKDTEKELLLWDLRWDSVEDAEEFISALQIAYTKRYDLKEPLEGSSVSLEDPNFGKLSITQDKKSVVLKIGM